MDDYTDNNLQMQIYPDTSMDVRASGDSGEVIASGIAIAIVCCGAGLGWALSKTRALMPSNNKTNRK